MVDHLYAAPGIGVDYSEKGKAKAGQEQELDDIDKMINAKLRSQDLGVTAKNMWQ
jgi:hypothetical protein